MGIETTDLIAISPELALILLASCVLFIDLIFPKKALGQTLGILGLFFPICATLFLWNQLSMNGDYFAFHSSLVTDHFALFFKLLILVVLGLVLLSCSDYSKQSVTNSSYAKQFRENRSEFTALLLFSSAGLMLLGSSADLITIYLSLELASLPLVALIAFGKSHKSLEAALKFLVLSAISSAILIYGFAFLYGLTGTMRIISITEPTIAQIIINSTSMASNIGIATAIVLITAGFGFKLSIVPFHMWTPDVYEGAPVPVGAFLSIASKAASFAVILRVFYMAFGDINFDWSIMFAALSVITMTVGNFIAIQQKSIKRLLGYSTIAHAGYMLIGIAAVTTISPLVAEDSHLGITSVLFYLCGYATMTLTAFFVALGIISKTGNGQIASLAGMGKRSPLLALMLSLSLVSLIGIPPTVGFAGKLFLFNAAVNSGLVWLAVLAVINSVISAYYYMSIIRIMYLREATDETLIKTSRSNMAALSITSISILVLGLWPNGLLSAANIAAKSLFA
ncbi:MAG: NADH-quinone oxidoreductase subunit N [Chloroflexi bacterium]|nr:NADH-quinone oxidoreductase subunit N [Chloroflexota bacterium]|tara:strand:+ start:28567 stop:30096 length:1530 start_codon:yes stop_codon:yes gene_type:complete